MDVLTHFDQGANQESAKLCARAHRRVLLVKEGPLLPRSPLWGALAGRLQGAPDGHPPHQRITPDTALRDVRHRVYYGCALTARGDDRRHELHGE